MKTFKPLVIAAWMAGMAGTGGQLFSQQDFLYQMQNLQHSPDAIDFEVTMVNLASEFSGQSRLIINVKVVNDELQFIKMKEGGFRADYEIGVALLDTAQALVDSMAWREEVTARDFRQANARDVYSFAKTSFDLPPAEYRFRIWLRDLETSRIGHREGSVTLRDFSSNKLLISDVLFMNSVDPGDVHLLESIEPGPGASGQGQLYVYFEVYNVPKSDSMKIVYQFYGIQNEVIDQMEYWRYSRGPVTKNYLTVDSKILSKGFTGAKITVTHNGEQVEAKGTLNWYRHRSLALLADIDDAIEKLLYIASDKELKALRQARGDEKVKAFLNFWKRHDPTPGTLENELMEEYYRRIEFANKYFPGNKEGWRTDMGMVYVKLGPPDYIDRPELVGRRHPYNVTESSYRDYKMEWHYYELGRRFIFYYRAGEFRLMNRNDVFDLIY